MDEDVLEGEGLEVETLNSANSSAFIFSRFDNEWWSNVGVEPAAGV